MVLLSNKVKRDGIIFIFLFLVLLALKQSILNQPYYWDALGYVIRTVIQLFDEGIRALLIKPPGHPPLIILLIALSWKVFGSSPLVSHLLSLFIGAWGLFFTFKLGELLYNKEVAVGGVLLLLFNQIFFTQVGIVYLDIPLLTFVAAATYYYFKRNITGFLFFGSLTVLTKITGILFIGAFFIHNLFENKHLIIAIKSQTRGISYGIKKGVRNIFQNYRILFYPLLPLILSVGWATIVWLKTGWILNPVHTMYKEVSIARSIPIFFEMIKSHFFIDTTANNVNVFNWIISAVIILYLLFNLWKRKSFLKENSHFMLFILFGTFNIAAFAATTPLPRYVLPLFPFFYIIGAASIYWLLKAILSHLKIKNLFYKKFLWRIIYLSSITIICLLFTTNYYGTRNQSGNFLESNMEYLDFLEIQMKAAEYIGNSTKIPILTRWPMVQGFRDPRFGFVKVPLNTTQHIISMNNTNPKIVILSPQAASIFINIDMEKLTLLREFKSNGKSISIYYSSMPIIKERD